MIKVPSIWITRPSPCPRKRICGSIRYIPAGRKFIHPAASRALDSRSRHRGCDHKHSQQMVGISSMRVAWDDTGRSAGRGGLCGDRTPRTNHQSREVPHFPRCAGGTVFLMAPSRRFLSNKPTIGGLLLMFSTGSLLDGGRYGVARNPNLWLDVRKNSGAAAAAAGAENVNRRALVVNFRAKSGIG